MWEMTGKRVDKLLFRDNTLLETILDSVFETTSFMQGWAVSSLMEN